MAGAPAGALGEILVIIFCLIKRYGGRNFGDDWFAVLRREFIPDRFSRQSLFLGRIKDSAPVVIAYIRPLAVQLRGVMQSKELAYQRLKADGLRVKFHQHRLSVPSSMTYDVFIARIFGVPASVAHRRGGYARHLIEVKLHSPKTPCCEYCLLHYVVPLRFPYLQYNSGEGKLPVQCYTDR